MPQPKLSRMDRKANEVWARIFDPTYYGVHLVLRSSSPLQGLSIGDEDTASEHGNAKCHCGRCKTCRKRVVNRRYQINRRAA